MRVRFLIPFALCLLPFTIFGQISEEIERIDSDSLLKVLPELEGIERIDVLNQIAFDLSRDNPDSSIAISLRTKQISENIDYQKGIGDALFNLGLTYIFLDSLKPGVVHFLDALQVYERVDTCIGMGLLFSQLLAINHTTGRYDKSIAYGQKAYKVYNALRLHNYKVIALQELGFTYTINKEFDSSEYYYELGLAILDKYPDSYYKASIYLNMGFNLTWENGFLDTIINNRQDIINVYLKAIDLSEKSQDSIVLGLSLNNLAIQYSHLGTEEGKRKWRETLLRLIDYGETRKIYAFTLVEAYRQLGLYEYYEGNITNAISLTEKAIRRGKVRMDEWTLQDYQNPFTRAHCRQWFKINLRRCYSRLYGYYEESGDYKKALEYYVLKEEIAKEIVQQENKDLVAILETHYENEQTRSKFTLLEGEKDLSELRKVQFMYIIIGLSAFLLLILLFGFLFIRLRKVRMEQKAMLREQDLKHDLELKELESIKLKEVDTMKSRFFANISHEFRTPLTLILGPLEVLKGYISKHEGEEELNIIERNALRLKNLINQLLNLAKLESGKMKLNAMEENIIKLSKTYCQSFESLARQRKIDFSFSSTFSNIPLFLDKDKFEKILYNLLSNAFKYTADGGRIVVSVDIPPLGPPLLAGRGGEAGGVKIIVSDTGKGILPDQLAHIFDRFYQAGDDKIDHLEGTGIGLALCKELVQLHHGEISVESVPGKGSRFVVEIPLGKDHLEEDQIVKTPQSDDTSQKTELVAADLIQKQNAGTLKTEEDKDLPLILIVEDNTDMRYYIRSNMTDEFHFIEAADGEEGLEKALETIPDLIISDVMMPRLDGMQLCHKLKTDERTSHIPVILLTARAAIEDRLEGLETGADDFLTKPFDKQELNVRINNLIFQRRKLQCKFNENALNIGLSKVLGLPESGISSTEQLFLLKAIEIINDHLPDENFTTEILHEKMALSYTQLYRKLKSLTDKSVTGFIRNVRLNRAAELIKANSGTITEIAFQVGFNNLSYFSKCFEEEFGVLPSQYHS